MGLFRFLKISSVAAAVLFTGLISLSVQAQRRYEDTLWIQVTYYDFHSDQSNPEFECDHQGGRKRGMVGQHLDADKKPVVGPAPYLNNYIQYWYRDWNDAAKGDFTKPSYRRVSGGQYDAVIEYDGPIAVNHDTSFINRVIHDSLPFLHIGNGMYEYRNDEFFPLDDDPRGFGREGRRHNFSFTMELHHTFTKTPGLTFRFVGDDDVWAFIDGQLVMDIGGIHSALADAFSLDTIPGLENNKTYELSFFYAERHTNESHIRITTNIISSKIDSLRIKAEPDTSVCPGQVVTLTSEVFDDTYGLRDSIAATTRWRVLNGNGNPATVLQPNIGSTVTVTPVVAYSIIVVEGMIRDEINNVDLRDTISIHVGPCEPYRIWIEADTIMEDTAALRYPQPLEQVLLTDIMNTAHVYAIARDSSGAFVRIADPITTQWSVTPDGIALIGVQGETNLAWHGIITRIGSEGETQVIANEPGLLPDSVPVVLAPYYIVKFRVVERGKNIITEYVESIYMTTDERRLYDVYGLKSTAVDDSNSIDSWVLVNADWDLSPPLLSAVEPPNFGSSWNYDPINPPGTGTLTLTNPNDARTETLVIPVTIVLGEVNFVDFRLITPANQRIAGDTLLAVVEIRTQDGNVPGTFCYGNNGNDPSRVIYQDNLGTGGVTRPDPVVVVDGISGNLNPNNTSVHSNDQCFENGFDTVKVVLYYAPFDKDSTHQLTVILNPSLAAKTEPFVLLPTPLDSIIITDENHDPVGDTIVLDSRTGESITVYSTGYDKYGNFLGFVNSNWASDGTLNPLTTYSAQAYIGTDGISDHQQGNICASETGVSGPVSDCFVLTIIGPGAQLQSAITRDINGNGFLDRIDLTFDKNIAIPVNGTGYFTIRMGNEVFICDSIVQVNPGDSVHYYVYLKEKDTKSPQTAWRPTVTIQNLENANVVHDFRAEDGAGPVIWDVVKTVGSDRTKDKITVYLSEPIFDTKGSGFEIFSKPDSTFNVWRFNPATQQFDQVYLLGGIATFSAVLKDSILEFNMTNGEDITSAHWFNINNFTAQLQDSKGNRANENNKKVNVRVEGINKQLNVAPNPMTPDLSKGSHIIQLRHEAFARQWAAGGSGALINARITIPPDSSNKVWGYLKIYDIAGNIVNYSLKQDLRALAIAAGLDVENITTLDLDFFWNGANHRGMKVAPGIYKIILTVDYSKNDRNFQDFRLSANVGVRK